MAGKEEQVKEAEANIQERLQAFDYGMELFFKEAGIEKAAVAQAVGLEEQDLAPKSARWLKEQMEAANKEAESKDAAPTKEE